jgi:hypothetical protein
MGVKVTEMGKSKQGMAKYENKLDRPQIRFTEDNEEG